MPTSHDIQKMIVQALRHGPLNMFVIAAEIHQAPFRVRAELKGLKRDRLVRDIFTLEGHLWELTDRGHRALYQTDQLELA